MQNHVSQITGPEEPHRTAPASAKSAASFAKLAEGTVVPAAMLIVPVSCFAVIVPAAKPSEMFV
ncbi:hypothetical protein [Granulicella arctica]|uniref:Uncharacterized protein n=1 Tax=Granulicella arctica TaxID=940613 RepID=A0A7Y9TG87_9BACT|nr:hypothetical protein [Granulicella arctica]NYF79646.1 hypothetical protein [Granulicella arctica]